MAWHDRVKTGFGWPATIGAILLLAGFGGFGAWAAMAPLEGAVIAGGTVTTLGRNKIIQHLEGGIVRDILVAEGDLVTAGQPLVLLEQTPAMVMRNRLQAQLDTLEAKESRAEAERDEAEAIAFPSALLASTNPAVLAAIKDQTTEFEVRLRRYNNEVSILNEQIGSLRQEIIGLQSQQTAINLQLGIVQGAKADLEKLLANDLVVKGRVLELQSNEAELIGQDGQLTATIAKANLMIGEKEYELQRLLNTRLEEASLALVDVRQQRTDLAEQLQTAQDTLLRTTITAPETGTVTNIAQIGPGSVISPGQRVMEILPAGADLIVEAQLSPRDVDQVHVGQDARLVFAALDQRSTPQVEGKVTYLSADRLVTEQQQGGFYLARLSISDEPLQGFDPNSVGAGQPVEVFITTGQRTFLSYLVEPLLVTLRRSVRE